MAVASRMSWLTLSASEFTVFESSALSESKTSPGTVTSRVMASPKRSAAAWRGESGLEQVREGRRLMSRITAS